MSDKSENVISVGDAASSSATHAAGRGCGGPAKRKAFLVKNIAPNAQLAPIPNAT